MKIALAQINPIKGDIEKNILLHQKIIDIASQENIAAIFFSELSITGYEPTLAKALKLNSNDPRFSRFQNLSDQKGIVIGIGVPLISGEAVEIAMLVFQPFQKVESYSKQILHKDEEAYFINGSKKLIINIGEYKLAPAICYESLQSKHLENALQNGANIYLASVAKSQDGIDKAVKYFPWVARENSINVLMSNCVGDCDNFQSAGQSTIWNSKGINIAQLPKDEEGVMIYDIIEDSARVITLG